MSYQLKLWDSKRERKLTSPNTLSAVRRTKGLSKSRVELTGYRPAQPHRRLEAGGRGKGQAQPQGPHLYRTANRPPVSNQRPPEILDGQHPPGRVVARHRVQAPDRQGRGLGLGTWRAEGALHQGRVRLSSSWPPEPLGQGRHKTQVQRSLSYIQGLEPRSAGHAPYRVAGSLSSVDGESNASPSLQCDGTSNLNKSPPPPICVRTEVRH